MYENLAHLSLLATTMLATILLTVGFEIRQQITATALQHELCLQPWCAAQEKCNGVYASITIRFQDQLISSLVKIGRPDVLTTVSDTMLTRIARQVSQLGHYETHSETLSVVETNVVVTRYVDGLIDKDQQRIADTKTLSLPCNPIKEFLRLRL